MSELSLFEVLRPYLWVAAIAFTIGFATYVAVKAGQAPTYAEVPAPAQVAASTTAA